MESDEYLAKVSQRVPGFAGFYVDANGIVVLAKGSQLSGEQLRQALLADPDLGRFHRIHERLSQQPIRVEASRYDAAELWDFKTRIRRGAVSAGAHSLDIDERTGTIHLEVSSQIGIARLRARVRALEIPDNAVVITVAEVARPFASLSDKLRPVPGGVKIEVAGGCTLTVNAFMTVSEEWGFFTNAHCSTEFGSATGEAAYQNRIETGNVIGWELVDPPLSQYGVDPECPDFVDSIPVAGCRYTDAAFYVYDNATLPDSLTVARTTNSSGSTTISSTHPRFHVSGISTVAPYTGLEVQKIGVGTGWTVGEVSGTCVDLFEDNSAVWIYCSTQTDLEAGLGDSGSPIFTWDGSSGDVELVGILWGGNSAGVYYSPWYLVYLEVEGAINEPLNYAY